MVAASYVVRFGLFFFPPPPVRTTLEARAGFSHRSHFVGCDQFSVIWLVWFPPRSSEDAASNPVSRCFLIFFFILRFQSGQHPSPILNYTTQRFPLVRMSFNVTRIIEKKRDYTWCGKLSLSLFVVFVVRLGCKSPLPSSPQI